MKKFINGLTTACVILNTILLIWIIGSVIEVNSHNNSVDDTQTKNPYNAVLLFAEALNQYA